MTIDFTGSQPGALNLNYGANYEVGENLQGTSHFATISQVPKTTKVRNKSLFSHRVSPTEVTSATDVSRPVFRRRRDYS